MSFQKYLLTHLSLIHIDAADETERVDLGGRRIIKKIFHLGVYGRRSLRVDDKPNCFCQLKIVFTSNIVTVIGPTPPGTGV